MSIGGKEYTLYFAYVDPGTAWDVSLARFDENIFDLVIEHDEGQIPSATIEVKNPHIGFLNPSRKFWVWISFTIEACPPQPLSRSPTPPRGGTTHEAPRSESRALHPTAPSRLCALILNERPVESASGAGAIRSELTGTRPALSVMIRARATRPKLSPWHASPNSMNIRAITASTPAVSRREKSGAPSKENGHPSFLGWPFLLTREGYCAVIRRRRRRARRG